MCFVRPVFLTTRARPEHLRLRPRHPSSLPWVHRPIAIMASQAKIIDGNAIAKCVLFFTHRKGIIDFFLRLSCFLFLPLPIYLSFDCPTPRGVPNLSPERSVIASHRASRNSEPLIRLFVRISSSSRLEIDQIARHTSG